MINILYVLAMLNLSSSIEILIAQTQPDKTGHNWIEGIIKKFESQIDWYHCSNSTMLECIISHPNASIVLDLSSDFEAQLVLSQICKENRKIYLTLHQMIQFRYYDEWINSIVPSNSAQVSAYFSVLSHLSWTRGLVITDESNINVKQAFFEYSPYFDFLTVESSTNVENLVNRVIKPFGSSLYYIFTNSALSLKIQKTLKSKKLLLKGDGIILNQNSGYGCNVDGAIIITDSDQEYINSPEEFLLNSTQNILQYLVNNSIEAETIEGLKYLLKIYNQKNQFSIVNIKEGKREIIGSVSAGTVKILKNFIFPGNTSDMPKSEKKILHVTISGGSTNPGAPSSTSMPLIAMGSYAAWTSINDGTSGILNNFQINHFTFDCGVDVYNEKFATACFAKAIDKFGLVHISPARSSMTIAEMKLFKKLNLTIPVVGAMPNDYSLNSTTLYPMFTRIVGSNWYTYSLMTILFKVLGWNKACALYYNNTIGNSTFSIFMKSAEQYGLEIINPESSRLILANQNRTTIKQYAASLKTIIDTQARLLISLLLPPEIYYVLEELYDMGLRKGDLLMFSISPAYLTMLQYDSMYTYKIKETGVPMISIDGQYWVGKAGQLAYSKIASLYKTVPISYTCYYYDAAYFIAMSLDYMINHGLDYYDPYQVNLTLRAQKFVGCSGKISIEKSSNNRIVEAFDIKANKIDGKSGNVTSYKVGEFHPYSSIMLAINEPVIYGDGTTNKPDDLRNQNNQCPFDEKLVRTFIKGRILTFGVCFLFALVSLAITVYIWKKWWNITIAELKERHEISLEDIIVELTILIESFQFAAMGPDITPINSFLAKIGNSFSFNLENFLKLTNGTFWILIDGVYGAIILWLILCFTILFRFDEKFPRVSIFRFLALLADYLMPILGNLCFIPLISMCLNVFLCDQSIGENFTDSFLAQDCYYFCWKDEHLGYAISSFIALLCYEPLAVFCRPLWQELQHKVHILASPLFLMVKTVVQIIFIVMNKTVKRADSTVHGALFAVLMTAYIAFIFRYKPYNYPRLCWWQALSLIGVLWLSVLSTVFSVAGGDYLMYFLLLCIGWIVIALAGVYVQRKKYPSLLYRRKGLDTTNIFKFAFAFGKHSKVALAKIVPSRASEDSLKPGY